MARQLRGALSIRASFWGILAAAANIEQGAAAVYRCIRRKRLGNPVAEFLLCKSKAKIAGEGGRLRDISKFNFQQELKVLIQSITVAINQDLGLDWSQERWLGSEQSSHSSVSQYIRSSCRAPQKQWVPIYLSFRIFIWFIHAKEFARARITRGLQGCPLSKVRTAINPVMTGGPWSTKSSDVCLS